MVTDEQLKNPKPEWGGDAPDSKEGYWYRCMFDEQFPIQCASTVMRWKPTWSNQTDPSGRWVFERSSYVYSLISRKCFF